MTKTESKITRATDYDILLSNPDGLHDVIRVVMQGGTRGRLDEALGASTGKRTPQRRLGYRSGYYGHTPVTRVGKLEPRVAQERDAKLARWLRS